MNLTELYRQSVPAISFELFPPKSDDGMARLLEQVEELAACNPAYITCTYGAGGSTRERTLEVLSAVLARHAPLPVASHLTCVGSTVAQLRAYLAKAQELGISHIVALRGDPPKGESGFRPAPGGLRHANELVALVRGDFPEFGIAVAGYPEKHPEAASFAEDLEHLKRKVDAGADVIITQLFYDNDDFFRFRDRCAAAGISAPIVPGVLPVNTLKQIERFTKLCGARLPRTLVERLAHHGGDEDGQTLVGMYYAAQQVDALIREGAPGIHFYVLNKSRSAAFICRALALGAPQPAALPGH